MRGAAEQAYCLTSDLVERKTLVTHEKTGDLKGRFERTREVQSADGGAALHEQWGMASMVAGQTMPKKKTSGVGR